MPGYLHAVPSGQRMHFYYFHTHANKVSALSEMKPSAFSNGKEDKRYYQKDEN
jgi:hypothetical protein